MTAGAEIHDGCLVFRSGNCVKTWKAGCLFRAKTWKAGCSSFCSCFLLEKLSENLFFRKNQFFAHVFSVFYMSKNLYGENSAQICPVKQRIYFFFVSDFNMSIYSEVRCDGWIDCGRMYPISM